MCIVWMCVGREVLSVGVCGMCAVLSVHVYMCWCVEGGGGLGIEGDLVVQDNLGARPRKAHESAARRAPMTWTGLRAFCP
jgi:hypothetical protein